LPSPPGPQAAGAEARADARDDALADTRVVGAGRPSKTQLKREAAELQALGAELAALPAERLARLGLPEPLLAALLAYRQTRTHEGRRRQLQYVGKLMRSVDAEPLREALAAERLGSARSTLRLHEAERWRAELLAGDDALERWQDLHPQTDALRLRSLVRAARRDGSAAPGSRQPASHRELYRFIEPMLSGS
jgi:ribosome-associated protein